MRKGKPYAVGPLVGLLLAAIAGCEQGDGAKEPDVQPVGDLHDMMTWVLDPAADVVWGSAGFVLTEEGEQDLSPTTDEAWAAVRHSAAVVAESGNLLLLPHLLPQDDELPADAWIEFSHAMTRFGQEAMAAVDAKDAEALFTVGGRLYNVCRACHQVYARPEDAGE